MTILFQIEREKTKQGQNIQFFEKGELHNEKYTSQFSERVIWFNEYIRARRVWKES